MDFKSLMAAQIAKNKPQPKDQTSSTSKHAPPKKYLKRSEVEAQRQAAYHAEQAALEAARIQKLAQKRKAEEDDAERARVRDEKRRRLAAESAKLRAEEEEAAERARRKRLGLPELPPKKEEVEEEVEKTPEPPKRVYEGPIPTTLEPVAEAEMKVSVDMAAMHDAEKRAFLFRQLASYFSMVLRAWEGALGRRTEEVKSSFQGKQAYQAMVQARENMRPLFRKMETGEVGEDILKPVVEIVHAAQERRYVDANDGYLRLSIGNAAWPIGVTMVGIHERSAREKLHDGDTAHIMSDETTRKYLQSIKRCLSFAQTLWPPDDQLQLMG